MSVAFGDKKCPIAFGDNKCPAAFGDNKCPVTFGDNKSGCLIFSKYKISKLTSRRARDW